MKIASIETGIVALPNARCHCHPIARRQLPFHVANCYYRLGSVSHFQRLENGGDVVLDGRLGKVERATDGLVAFALHNQRKHIDLPFGKPEHVRRNRVTELHL